MKKGLLFFVFLFISVVVVAQSKFKKAYLIKSDKKKIECFIKKKRWGVNPEHIHYKLRKKSPSIKLKLEEIEEFKVYGDSIKFIKRVIDMDMSDPDIEYIESQRRPKFSPRIVLLKVLYEGEYNLYSYDDVVFERYFYSQPCSQKLKKKLLG